MTNPIYQIDLFMVPNRGKFTSHVFGHNYGCGHASLINSMVLESQRVGLSITPMYMHVTGMHAE